MSLRDRITRITACGAGGLEERCELVRAVFDHGATSETLSELYDLCIELLSSSQANEAVTAAAAALVFLSNGQPSELILRQFTQTVFLQLAADIHEEPVSSQLLHKLVNLLASSQAWTVAYELLQCSQLILTTGTSTSFGAPSSNAHSSSSSDQQGGSWHISVQLPVVTASIAAKEVAVVAVLQHLSCQQQEHQQVSQAVSEITQYCTGPLFTTACQLLAALDPALRKAAFQVLLPALLRAADAISHECYSACVQLLWQQCLGMIGQPALPRRMGLAVLLQYHTAWPIQPSTATTTAVEQDSDSSEQFWGLIRECLVDSEALNRKRAFRLLQLLLPEELLQQQPVWSVFMALYELLDEFSPHLVKASWPMISQLHPVAPEYCDEDAAADVAASNQLNVIKATSKEQKHQQQQQCQQLKEAVEPPMAFCWTSVLWTRALQHKNLQVQRMAMKTLIKRHWTASTLAQVPPSFITAVLLPALLNPVHHKIAAAAGLSATGGVMEATASNAKQQQQQQQQAASSMATAHPLGPGSAGSSGSSFSIVTRTAEVLSTYTSTSSSAAARDVLAGGLQLLAAPGVDLPRSGLLAVLGALAAAAAPVTEAQRSLLQDLEMIQAAAYADECLVKLQALLARLVTYAGQRFRISCYNLLVTTAAAVAPPGACSLAAAARLLQNMPAWMQGPGGPLHRSNRAWLLGSSSSSSSTWLRDSSMVMWQKYFSSKNSDAGNDQQQQQQQWHPGPKDYASWRSSCNAWLRVVLACDEHLNQHLTAAASDLSNRVEQLTTRSYLAPDAAEKSLVMLTCLLETADTAGQAAVAAGEQLPVLTQVVLRLAEAVAAPLTACLSAYSSCYRSSPAHLTSSNSSAPVAAVTAAAWASAARAEAAAQVAAATSVLLARWVSGCWSSSSSSTSADASGAVSSKRAMPALLLLLSRFAQIGEQLSAEALLRVSLSAAHQQGGLVTAAADEQMITSALKVLTHAALSISRAVLIWPEAPVHTLQFTPATWVHAVLRKTAAAQAAKSHWQAAAAANGNSSLVPELASGWTGDMDWKCLDAVMMLTTMANSTPSTSSHPAGVAGFTAAEASSSAAGCTARLSAAVLSSEVVCGVFQQGLDALQWSSIERGSDLVDLLTCLRRVWARIVADEQLQVDVYQSLQAAGVLVNTSSGSSRAQPLVSLARALGNGLLDVLRSSKKRPQIMYSLTINTLLLPQLCMFDHQASPSLSFLHEGPHAPLRRFIQGLLAQGCKGSPRLMLALGLQLGAYLAGNAQLLVWYAAELRQLLMFGVAAQVGPEELTLVMPTVEDSLEHALLAEPLDPELQEAYALTDIGPRVAVCCGLYQLAQQAGLLHGNAAHDNSSSGRAGEDWVADVEAAGVQLWQQWLQSTVHDPVLCGERFKVGSDIHRLKVRAWQGLAVAANFISSSKQQAVAAAAVKELMAQLSVNNPPSIKQYQEAIVAHLLLQHKGLLEELLLPQFASVEKGNTATGSHILIAVQVALHSQPQVQTRVLPVLVKQLLPWTNHHTHNIRTFAQLGFCAIMDIKPLSVWSGWREGLGPGGADVLGELLRFMHDNTDFQRFRRAMGAGILSWSPVGVTSPRRIFSSALHLAGAEETPVTFEGVPETLMDRIITFLAAERAKLREAAVDRVAGYEGGLTATVGSGTGSSAAYIGSSGPAATAAAGGPTGLVVDFQRKVSPHERAALMADVLGELDEGGDVTTPAGTQRHELIVVASLISKVPNLGGLARTAEVLGAGALVLSDKRVAAEAGFMSVSVTAERWVPLIEVKEAVLIPWLTKKQAEGYTLVGLEQTAESTCLPSYKFPSKTVLVLGREKEGVPPEIIAMLDATVEIPQLGVIRSLNVHVSGAIAMYEYTKQQLPAFGS